VHIHLFRLSQALLLINALKINLKDTKGYYYHLITTQLSFFSSVLCLASNTSTLFTGSRDWTIRGWDKKTRECTKEFVGHGGAVYSLAVQGDKFLFSGSEDRNVICWSISQGYFYLFIKLHFAYLLFSLLLSFFIVLTGNLSELLLGIKHQ